MASQKQFNQETNGAELLLPGAQTALLLAASKPATILLLGRDESKAAPTVESVKAASPSTTVKFIHYDLGEYPSIKTAAESILAITLKIHTLINNAGVMAPAEYNTAAEAIIAAASKGARIVNLPSIGWSLGEVRFDDYNFNDGKDYDKWSTYGQSKSANILFTVELAKRLKSKGVHTFAVHPGVIITNLVRELDPEKDYGTMTERFNSRGHIKMDGPFPWKTLEAGTSTTLVAVLDPALKNKTYYTHHSGAYLADCQIAETTDYTTNPDYAERLWALSEKLVGQKFDL
ncbi:hypothetical protein EAF00_006545 [Botryotinia globosa]|nr:hypothetical protein EAF00_006545 [Botryotinia globosa]